MLIGAIAAALDKLEPIDQRVFAPLMAPRPNLWSVVIPRLGDALATRQQPFVLVLDDLHRVHDHLSLEPLATLAERMPEGSQLAIASRENLPIPLGRLRTQRTIVELSADDLALTSAEAEAAVSSLGIELEVEILEPALERIEGWPAGIYLLALVLGASDDSAAAVAEISGDSRVIADYLREEFIAGMPEEHRQFLTRTAVLDHLAGPICDHVLDRQGSARMLKELASSNLLLTPLDRQDREYRLHSLLRELLVADLREGDGELEPALRHRACFWYADRGEPEQAVPQAIASGDEELAADLIWSSTAWLLSSGRGGLLERWLDQFGEASTARSPALAMARATDLATCGDGAGCEHWVAVAREALKGAQHPGADSLHLAGQVLKAGVAARGGIVAMRTDVEHTYELLPEHDPWRSFCCLILGTSWHLSGDRAQASRWLEEGSRRGLKVAPNVGMLCLAQLSLVADDEGDRDESHRLADEAIAAAEHFGLEGTSTSALAFAVAALAQAQRGRADEASSNLRVALRLLAGLNEFSDWYEAETRIVAARTLLLLDDVINARGVLAEAGRYITRTPDAPVLGRWTEAAWQDADTTARSISDRWPLTPAELRLLRFLPTHLNMSEIAAEMFVSPNTVKSHAKSVYRKLDVSSRADAVTRAREAGLLDQGAPLPKP